MAKINGNNQANTIDGTSGKDKIKGYGGDDQINGLDGNDFIWGGDGNDTITGGGGNDWIDGGKGIDTVLFTGAYAEYVIDDGFGHHHGHGHSHHHEGHHYGHDKLTVKDTVANRDGTDRLDDVEFLQFIDATVNVDTGDVAQWTYAVNTTLDPAAQDPSNPGDMYAGDGLNAANFGIALNAEAGIELGLKVHHRGTGGGPTYVSADDYSDGVLHFEVQDGPAIGVGGVPKAEWSFDFSIATGLNGATTDLDDFTFKLLFDVDPTAAVSYRTLVLEAEGTPQPAGESGYQWRDVDSNLVFIVDDDGNGNVTQNSENYGFFQPLLTSVYGPGNNFAGPAYFDIQLQAFDGAQLIAQNHIAVDVVL